MNYITTTFSPMMLSRSATASVRSCALDEIPADAASAVGHEVTAKILSVLLGREVPFARINLSLHDGDRVYCVIPGFRAREAREFSREEVEAAGFRSFCVDVSAPAPAGEAESELRRIALERYAKADPEKRRSLVDVAAGHSEKDALSLPADELDVQVVRVANGQNGKRPRYIDERGRVWCGTFFGNQSTFRETKGPIDLAYELLSGAELARFRARFPESRPEIY